MVIFTAELAVAIHAGVAAIDIAEVAPFLAQHGDIGLCADAQRTQLGVADSCAGVTVER